MNVTVVQARARPGADAGAITSFAAAAGAQLEDVAALVEAMLALGRPHRGSLDAATIACHTATLLRPSTVHRGIRLTVDGDRSAPVTADPTAVRLAIVAALLAVTTAEFAGTEGADAPGAPTSAVRCTILPDDASAAHILSITPRRGAELSLAIRRALSAGGVAVTHDDEALRLVFPTTCAASL